MLGLQYFSINQRSLTLTNLKIKWQIIHIIYTFISYWSEHKIFLWLSSHILVDLFFFSLHVIDTLHFQKTSIHMKLFIIRKLSRVKSIFLMFYKFSVLKLEYFSMPIWLPCNSERKSTFLLLVYNNLAQF